MMTGQFGVRGGMVSVVAVMALIAAACDSGGGGSADGPSSSAGSPSASVAAGVEKDSVLDLNSTKDMTGVVTTVPIGKSPYDKNMPDICGFITQAAMDKLGMATKAKGYSGSPLIVQSCAMQPALNTDTVISANIYVNSLEEHLAVANLRRVRPDSVPLYRNVMGYVLQNRLLDGVSNGCEVAWGTFYGTAAVIVTDAKSGVDICGRAESAARIIGPQMPTSPSQMRPTS